MAAHALPFTCGSSASQYVVLIHLSGTPLFLVALSQLTPPSLLSIRPMSVLLINTWVLSNKSQSIWYPVVTSSPLETQSPPGLCLVYTCCHVLPPLDVLTVLPKSVAKQISGFNGDIPMEKGFSPHVGPKRLLIQPPSKFAEGILPSF